MKIKNRKDFMYYRVKEGYDPKSLQDFLYRNAYVLECFGTCQSKRQRYAYQFKLMRRSKDYKEKENKDHRLLIDIRVRNYVDNIFH